MKNAKIVVVDDDQDIRDSLQYILEDKGYIVTTAANKTDGMQQIKDVNPDLAILDVMMDSWQDGFDLARELKSESSSFKSMPILMLTGAKKETGINFESNAGDPDWCPVDAFLHKPVEPDALLAEIEKLLP